MTKRPPIRDLEPPPERSYEKLTQEICVTHGFCGGWVDGRPSRVDNFIPVSGVVTAAQFAKWVVEAEGMNAEYSTYLAPLEVAFVRHMGSAEVDATTLKWSV